MGEKFKKEKTNLPSNLREPAIIEIRSGSTVVLKQGVFGDLRRLLGDEDGKVFNDLNAIQEADFEGWTLSREVKSNHAGRRTAIKDNTYILYHDAFAEYSGQEIYVKRGPSITIRFPLADDTVENQLFTYAFTIPRNGIFYVRDIAKDSDGNEMVVITVDDDTDGGHTALLPKSWFEDYRQAHDFEEVFL